MGEHRTCIPKKKMHGRGTQKMPGRAGCLCVQQGLCSLGSTTESCVQQPTCSMGMAVSCRHRSTPSPNHSTLTASMSQTWQLNEPGTCMGQDSLISNMSELAVLPAYIPVSLDVYVLVKTVRSSSGPASER